MRYTKIKHVLVRHEEGGGHMAEGYTRAAPGKSA
jgi:glyoxylate carboligase